MSGSSRLTIGYGRDSRRSTPIDIILPYPFMLDRSATDTLNRTILQERNYYLCLYNCQAPSLGLGVRYHQPQQTGKMLTAMDALVFFRIRDRCEQHETGHAMQNVNAQILERRSLRARYERFIKTGCCRVKSHRIFFIHPKMYPAHVNLQVGHHFGRMRCLNSELLEVPVDSYEKELRGARVTMAHASVSNIAS